MIVIDRHTHQLGGGISAATAASEVEPSAMSTVERIVHSKGWKRILHSKKYKNVYTFFFISNSIFQLSLGLLTNLPKSRLKVAKKLLNTKC